MNVLDQVCADVGDRPGRLDDLVADAVRRLAPLSTAAERRRLQRDAVARMEGLGELDRLVDDPTIDEVLVNGDEIWIDRDGRLVRAGELRAGSLEQVVERILAPIGRRVDRTSPIVDARLPGGARVCAVVPPVSVSGPTLSIRRFPDEARPIEAFTDAAGVAACRELVSAGANVVVCGATSSGKTSLLAALVAEVDDAERVIVLEDTSELPCRAPHLVRMEARPESPEGVEAIPLERLVRTALRLRPDRLVVGEVRGDEVLALCQAMNTGHDGSFSTCHANGPLDALLRLESLVLQAAPQWPLIAVRRQLARSIDVVVHVSRRGARRLIESISEVVEPTADEPPGLRPLASIGDDGRLVRTAALERRRRR